MKRLLVGGLTAAAALLALAVWRGSDGGPEVRLSGIVSAHEAPVASELPGRVLELRANRGDRVSQGQVVAVLATEQIDAQIQSKRAAVDQTSARLEQARERIRLETERVESRIDEAMAALRALEKEQVVIRAELDQARRELARAKEIFAQGLIPRQQVDREVSAVKVIEARLKSAGDQVEEARANLEKERSGERKVRVMQQELQQTAAQAAQARYELEQVTVRLGRTELRSPLTGIVSAKKAREGELVPAGAPVLTIADPNDVWIRAQVDETLVSRLVVGQPLRVVLASSGEIDGKLTFISSEAAIETRRGPVGVDREVRSFEIKIALVRPVDGIQPGMTASVIVPDRPVEVVAAHPTVPLAAGTAKETAREKDARPSAEAAPPAATGGAVAAQEESPAISKPADGPAGNASKASKESQSSVPPSKPIKTESRQAGADAPTSEGTEPSEEAAQNRMTELTPARPAPSVEELLESIDLEDPTEEELRQLEASMLREAADQEAARGEMRPNSESPAVAPVVNPPQFLLEGISVAGGRPVAVINGARVFEGDSVDGARVILIMGGMVQLSSEGRTITLRF
jgi:HlyD family secretion protein